MNIFQTSTAFYPSMGGAQLHWFTIAKMLAERGHEVTGCGQWKDHRNRYLIDSTLKAPWGDDQYEAGPITVHRYQPSVFTRAWMGLLLPFCLPLPEIGYPPLSRYFAKRMAALPGKPDIVMNIRIGREHFSWASYHLAKKRGVPFVICPNYSPRMQSKFGQVVMRNFFRLLRKADGVVVFTPAERDEMIRLGVKPENILLIGVGPLLADDWDTTEFQKKYGIKEKMVLFLGQKLEYKGFDTLIEAAPKVWEKHPETTFVFIGPHYPGTKKVFENIDDPRIVDIPRIDAFDPIKVAALDAANVFALPSRQEGIGGVYIEAWALKKPVIACKIPFLTIRDGVDGVMVEQDGGVLAEKLIWFLDNPAEARKMGEAGYQRVQNEYSWNKIVSDVEAFFKELRARQS